MYCSFISEVSHALVKNHVCNNLDRKLNIIYTHDHCSMNCVVLHINSQGNSSYCEIKQPFKREGNTYTPCWPDWPSCATNFLKCSLSFSKLFLIPEVPIIHEIMCVYIIGSRLPVSVPAAACMYLYVYACIYLYLYLYIFVVVYLYTCMAMSLIGIKL